VNTESWGQKYTDFYAFLQSQEVSVSFAKYICPTVSLFVCPSLRMY